MAKRSKQAFDAEKAETMSSAEIAVFLDERARRFCVEYNLDGNGTQAAIRAGYKPGRGNSSAAHRAAVLLRDPRVRAYRMALIRESVEDLALSKEAVILRLMEIVQRCMTAEPVLKYDETVKDWVESGEWQFDSRGATRALQQLSKMLGYDAPALQKGEGGELVVRLQGLGDRGG